MQASEIKKIRSLKDAELIGQARVAAQEERAAGIKLLWLIREIESRILFSDCGYGSLLDFCVRELGLSETSALRRIRSARLLAEVQSLFQQEERETGRKRSKEEKRVILEKIEQTSVREAGKILEDIFSLPDQEEAKPKKKDKVKKLNKVWREISFVADQDLVEKLEKIKALVGHKNFSSLGEVVAFMVDLTLQKIDPLEKVKRDEMKKKAREEKKKKEEDKDKQVEKENKIDSKQHRCRDRNTEAEVERALWKRSEGRCEKISKINGKRCNSTYKLQIAHLKPFAMGGEQNLENLAIFCSSCNKRDAIRVFGRAHMSKYYSS